MGSKTAKNKAIPVRTAMGMYGARKSLFIG
jgi:hypothetical protein